MRVAAVDETGTHSITLRRSVSAGAKGAWVRNEDTKDFVKFAEVTHIAGSGNKTLRWDLPPGVYTVCEKWYGKETRYLLKIVN